MSLEWCIYLPFRIFELQFLLLGKEEHMMMCFQYSKNEWYLYDNDPTKPSFQPFEWESHVNYVKCLAGYVNITQANEDKLGKSCSLISVWVWDIFNSLKHQG